MAKNFDHKSIEAKWQSKWLADSDWRANDASEKPKFYPLIEFPYPSGAGLHIGHPRPYVGMDLLARKKRRDGFNVLYPIGWDAFGLPTENYAIKTGKNPRLVTKENSDTFRRQIQSLGISFDWSREINTTDPKYYKWTQWIFLQLYEKGLAYKGTAAINWCPKDKIGLANEEVVDGKCERCGTEVEKKTKEQWMLAITKYAKRLHDDLDTVDYIERAKTQQKNWIGPSEGAHIDFKIANSSEVIRVFTTRPDTLFGATYIVLAPEHGLIEKLKNSIQNYSEISTYRDSTTKKKEADRTAEGKEKTGVEVIGIQAVNPANGEEIPVWIADYVLNTYGTGAIMAVPAHDERDAAFAVRFNLPARIVVSETGTAINSGQFDGMKSDEAKRHITEFVRGELITTYKLRDWVFSRQRYWGEPIPMVKCDSCGWVPVPDNQLPVELPQVERYEPTDTGESPLANIRDWVETACPSCGKPAERETDVMPNWAGSSWYYLRYADPSNDTAFADKKKLEYFTPVDWYNGGMEHTVLHLLYSRFWHKFLYDIGVVPTSEPYKKRTSHGVILAEDGTKMSKSKGNVINPDDMVEKVGADALRVYEMFMGPFDQAIAWSYDGLVGARKFLERVADLPQKMGDTTPSSELEILTNKTIKKVGDDIESMKFNTAVSQLMVYSNELGKLETVPRSSLETLLSLLAPFAPHLCEEMWHELGNTESIHKTNWPQFDPAKLESDEVTIAVQISGKVRGTCTIPRDAAESDVVALVRSNPKLGPQVPTEMKKVVYVPGRIINFIGS